MRRPTFPPKDHQAYHFLDVMRRNTQHCHEEYVQAPDNARMLDLYEYLQQLGWAVEYIDKPNPKNDPAVPVVRAYYIGEHSLAVMIGEQ